MTAKQIIDELPKLSDAERQVVLTRLQALSLQSGSWARGELVRNAAAPSVDPAPNQVDLQTLGINQSAAADLRARLHTFAEDWDREEASIYDEHPTR